MRRSLLIILMAVAGCANGANIGMGKSQGGRNIAGIFIEGAIVPGDFEKFRAVVLQRENIDPVWLASPGGDFVEAMKIGELVRELKLSVWAPYKNGLLFPVIRDPANAVCARACFYIYATGVQRRGEVLGVHRPYLSQSALVSMTLDEAARAQAVVLQNSSTFLLRAGVSPTITERIGLIGSNEIIWLTDADVLKLNGFIPEFEEWFKAKCAIHPKTQLPLSQVERSECQGNLLAQEQAVAKFQWLLQTAPRSKN